MLIIEPIKAFDDNYIWLMTKNNKSVVVDPGDASEIVKLIDNQAINLEGVLITHHHYDHTNGLAELIEKKNLSKSAFAKEIGIQRSSLAHFFSGRNKPSLDFFLKIKDRYPETDLNWIISGKKTKVAKKNKIKSIIRPHF